MSRRTMARHRRRSYRRLLAGIITLGLLGLAQLEFGPVSVAAAATAATQTLTVSEDSYVRSDEPTGNFGTAQTLNNQSGTPEQRAYLKFNVPGVTGITKVTFRAFTLTSSGSGYELHSVADNSWTEGGLNYNNRPAVGPTIGRAKNFKANTWTTVDVTSVVTGSGTFSFEMNATSSSLKLYSSREAGANAPQLVIESSTPPGPPAAIAPVSGTTPQTAAVNTAFATNLAARVTDAVGQAVSGASVTFTAPASGASGTFAGGGTTASVTTGVDGVATAPQFTANGTAGSYTATAAVAGVTPATFNLTNTTAPSSLPITTSQDSYVQADQPGTNFGTATVLKNVTSPDTRAYLKFNVPDVSGTITRVTFRAFTLTSSGSGYELHSVADNSWTEGGLNYNNRPAVGPTIGSARNFSANTWTSVDVTSVVRNSGTFSFEMNATSGNLKQYSSREGANPAQLVVEFTPTSPPTALAVAAGNGQSAATGTAFAVALAARATDAGGNPVSGVTVTFAAPTSGASGTFAGTGATVDATTGANGIATAPTFTANSITGSYQVSATTPGVPAPASFDLTNTVATAPTAVDVADAYVRSDVPAGNFGSDTILIGRTSPQIDSYIKFDVTGLSGAPGKATLRLWMETTGTTSYRVYQVVDTSWTESGITFNNRPAFGFLLGSNAPTTAGTWMDLEVTGAVDGNGLVSFGLASGSTAGKNFGSKEDAAHAPQLLLEPQPPASGDPVVGAVGDIACDPADPNWNNNLGQNGFCHHMATSDLALALNPLWMLTLGDHQYNGGTASQFAASYDPTWGRLKAITRPVLGNHEFGTSGASGYFNYFGDAATPLQPGCRSNCDAWYSFDVGAWHIVALNTECDRNSGNCNAGSAQETWLRSDLQSHQNACTLVYTHHPRWSSNSFAEPGIDALVQTMYDNNVDLMLVGHSHTYERFAPQNPQGARDDARGITEIVNGNGGRDFSGFSTPSANSLARNNNTYGILKLTLHATSADFRFLPDQTSGLFVDTGTVNCH